MQDELKHMILIMHGHEMNGTIREASNYLDSIDTGYGVFNFQQFATMRGKYPAVFQPVYALQTHMKQHSLGLFWWNLHKVNFHEAKQEEAERLAITMMKEQKEKERAEEMLNELMLKKRMGILYYLLPWERAKEMRKMQRIVAIEKELDA